MRPLFLFESSSSWTDLKTELWSTNQVDCRSRTRIHSSLAIRCDTIHNEAHTLPIALSDAILITIRNARSTVGLLHIDSDILLNAAAYLFCCLRRDVFHETSKGWISIQDTRPHVSGMQTRETLSHSKLCDFIFQKIWWALASLSWVDKRHESSVRIGNVQGKQ